MKHYVKVTCAFQWARKLPCKTETYESVKCVPDATPISVPVTDLEVTYLSGNLGVGYVQLGPGSLM